MKTKSTMKKRGRPVGSKNKTGTLSPWGRVRRTLSVDSGDPSVLPTDNFNYDTLREDYGVVAPREDDLREELDLMRTKMD